MNYKDYFTKNRKLKIEEYDEDGKLIDSVEFSKDDLWWFCVEQGNSYRGLDVAIKSDREYFKNEELDLFKQMIEKSGIFKLCISRDEIDMANYIFNRFTKNQIKFGLEFKNYIYNTLNYNFYSDDEILIKEKNFIQILDWINKSEGFYYAIDNYGNKGMAYINKPTSKQTKYQMKKHNKRIVFFSFNDWKEHLVNI